MIIRSAGLYPNFATFVCSLGYTAAVREAVTQWQQICVSSTRRAKGMARTAVQSADLQSLQILNWVPRERMNLLSRHMTELLLGKGEVLYRPGQPAKQLFCVLEGSVGLSLLGSKGKLPATCRNRARRILWYFGACLRMAPREPSHDASGVAGRDHRCQTLCQRNLRNAVGNLHGRHAHHN